MGRNNAYKIGSIYIGTVIGAGFASGQEIMWFFTEYGFKGIYGIIMAAILFSFIGSYVLLKVYQYRVASYHEWLYAILGPRVGNMTEKLLSLLLLSGYCVMVAGSGALLKEHFGYGKEIGIILMSMISCGIFMFSIKGLTYVNAIIVPLLLAGILSMGGWVLVNSGFVVSNQVGTTPSAATGNWITSSLLYVSYNSIGATMVMSSLYPLLNNKRSAIGGGVIGGLGLGLMAVFLLLPTLILYTDIVGLEIPMMAIASKFGKTIEYLYGVLLWFAMLTTAIANGFVFIQTVEKKLKIHHHFVCILFCIFTIPLSNFGFKNLVHTLYPLFGYIGIFIILLMIYRGFNRRK